MLDDKIAAIFGLGVPSFAGLILYFLFFFAVIRNKSLRHNPYFQLAISQGVADCTALLIQVVYSTPASFFDRLVYGDKGDHVLGFLLAIAWYSSLATIVCMAINRYIAICKPNSAWVLQEHGPKMILGSWVVGLIVAVPTAANCCRMVYYPEGFGWSFDLGTDGGQSMAYADLSAVCSVTALVFVCNGLIFARILKQHQQVKKNSATCVHCDSRREHSSGSKEEASYRNFFQRFHKTSFVCTNITYCDAQKHLWPLPPVE